MNNDKLSAIDKIFPLTAMQQGMLFHTLKDEQSSAYFSQHVIEMHGSIDTVVFQKSIEALSERFEIFRTRIMYKKLNKPMQVVLKNADMRYELLDLSHYGDNEKKTKIDEYLEQDKARGFDLDKDILCRVTLIKLSDTLYQNIWSFHHIILDGFCIGIIADDFFKIYNFVKNDQPINLPEVVSYQVYQNWLEKHSSDVSVEYWGNYLNDYNSNTVVPCDRELTGEKFGVYTTEIPEKICAKAIEYSSDRNITVNILMQCVWGILLQVYNSTSDVVFGNVMVARPLNLKNYDKIVGLFANTLPVRVSTSGVSCISDLVSVLNSDFLNAMAYSYCSLGEIQSIRRFNGELVNHLYLFQNFSLDNLYSGAKNVGLEITDMYIKHNTNYDFCIEITQKTSIGIKISYNGNKYSKKYIAEIASNISVILEGVVCENIENIDELKKIVKISSDIMQHDNFSKIDEVSDEYVEPSTELEISLANIFKKALNIDKISTLDDFFYMGGNSLKGMQVIAMCEQQGIPLKLSELFVGCNIQNIAKLISKKKTGAVQIKLEEKVPIKEDWYKPFPLNDIQKAYIIGQDASFELGMFSTQYYTEFEGDINIDRLAKSVDKVLEHQMALRTRIIDLNEQIIIKHIDNYNIPVYDVTACDEAEKNKILDEIRQTMSIHTVNLEDYPYFQIKAVKLSENYYRICFNIDCLCIDGFGLGMMLKEIKTAYQNPEFEFAPIEFSVRDYNIYLEELKNTPKYEEDKKYWLNRIDTLPVGLELPFAKNTEDIRNPKFLRKEYLMTEDEYKRLKKFSSANRVTVPAVICTAYMVVLAFWSGQRNLTVNMTVFDRHNFNHDVNKIIGDFTKLIYVETNMNENNFIKQVKKVNDGIINDLEHSSYSSMEFMRKLVAKRHFGTKAVLPYVFTCAISDELEEADTEFFKNVYSISRTPQVYIDNQVTQRGNSIFINWDYPEGLFDENMIEAMFNQYIKILLATSNEVSVSIPESHKLVIDKYNASELSIEEIEQINNTSLIDLIKDSFVKYSDNIAIKDSKHSISYKELDSLSDEVACKLTDDGIKAGDCIGIMGNRTVEAVVNMIGAVKRGATYVPINIEYPKDRIDYMMQKSGCIKILNDDYASVNATDCRKFEKIKVDPNSNAYIIFTSGSTGNPKGVVIKHNSAVNTIIDINKKFNVNKNDRLICLASFGFDLSVYDIYGALYAGAEMYICNQQKNPEELVAVLEQENITVWNSVPAVMQMLVSSLKSSWKNTSLRLILMSGDWIPVKLPAQIKEYFPNAEVISLGGATEGSIWSIYYPIGDFIPNINSIPYGIPLSNQKMYVMNEKLELCPIGVRGEICIGGIGVASGYINDIEKTEKAFIHHPKYGYIYKTGDYGKMHKEGFIEFLGRIDNQVKIHGYRVELGEIEAKAIELDEVNQAIVILQKQGVGATLKMFLESNKELNVINIKEKLKTKLPEYMIPHSIVCMKQFPVTSNGKIDRKQLLEISINESITYRTFAKNDKEKMLANIWKKVLEVDTVEINRSFFEFGGDSLKAIQIISEIKNNGYEISLMDIYLNDTIEKIAGVLRDSVDIVEEDDDMFEEGML